MLFNFAAVVFVLAIVFLNSLYGLYSGLINLFCAITALAVAFGYFEAFNHLLTGQFGLHPGYTEPFALILPFVVTLIVLRVLADQFIRGNVRVPRYLDWVGGGVCGFVIGQVVVGVMALGVLMLPWGGTVAMYQPIERQLDDPEQPASVRQDPQTNRALIAEHGMWLGSDRFAVGLFNLLSSGSLSRWEGERRVDLASVYPDFVQWVHWTGNTVQPESIPAPVRDKQIDGVQNGLAVERWWLPKAAPEKDVVYRTKHPTSTEPEPAYEQHKFQVQPGHKLVGVRLVLKEPAADRADKNSVNHRFRPTMIRLVGERSDGATDQAFPVILGGVDAKLGTKLRVVDADSNLSVGGGDVKVDAYFEVPDDWKPRFVEYRRHARAALPALNEKDAKAAQEPERLALGGSSGADAAAKPAADKATGAARFVDNIDRDFRGKKLPLQIAPDKLQLDTSVDGQALVSGKFAGDKSSFVAAAGRPAVTELKPPQGQGVVNLHLKVKKALSLFGKAMNIAGGLANQYSAVDDRGSEHPLAGYYAIVKRGNEEYVEFYYYPTEDLRTENDFRGNLKWQYDRMRQALEEQDDAVLGLIFVVPTGTSLTHIKSQGGSIELGERIREEH